MNSNRVSNLIAKPINPSLLLTQKVKIYSTIEQKWKFRIIKFDGNTIWLMHPEKHRVQGTRVVPTDQLLNNDFMEYLPMLNSPYCATLQDTFSALTLTDDAEVKYVQIPDFKIEIGLVEKVFVFGRYVRKSQFVFTKKNKKKFSSGSYFRIKSVNVLGIKETNEGLLMIKCRNQKEFDTLCFVITAAWKICNPEAVKDHVQSQSKETSILDPEETLPVASLPVDELSRRLSDLYQSSIRILSKKEKLLLEKIKKEIQLENFNNGLKESLPVGPRVESLPARRNSLNMLQQHVEKEMQMKKPNKLKRKVFRKKKHLSTPVLPSIRKLEEKDNILDTVTDDDSDSVYQTPEETPTKKQNYPQEQIELHETSAAKRPTLTRFPPPPDVSPSKNSVLMRQQSQKATIVPANKKEDKNNEELMEGSGFEEMYLNLLSQLRYLDVREEKMM